MATETALVATMTINARSLRKRLQGLDYGFGRPMEALHGISRCLLQSKSTSGSIETTPNLVPVREASASPKWKLANSDPGQVPSREQLLSHVWGYDFDPGSNVVDVDIRYCRK